MVTHNTIKSLYSNIFILISLNCSMFDSLAFIFEFKNSASWLSPCVVINVVGKLLEIDVIVVWTTMRTIQSIYVDFISPIAIASFQLSLLKCRYFICMITCVYASSSLSPPIQRHNWLVFGYFSVICINLNSQIFWDHHKLYSNIMKKQKIMRSVDSFHFQ